ncbi:type II toxin-antitoxin system prevent-host-death family antitoxin [Winslowiella toletana]|nr:type II toxin-antitoxin system prevent-host-death family antitoxin [Winslowiella toletana]WNN44442.1 type II toxin-antitoxin system prevent-host-death family antitoxin [Winslowiella toletana]
MIFELVELRWTILSLAPLAFEPLMKTQREPIEISKHGKRVAVLISAEE